MREYFVRIWAPEMYMGLEIRIGYVDRSSHPPKIYILQGEEFKEMTEHGHPYPCTLRIPEPVLDEGRIAQQLVDNLIKYANVKPSIPIRNNEELEAVTYHLEDMRKLVFKEKR